MTTLRRFFDLGAVANLFGSAAAAGVTTGVGSIAANPEWPWQVHAAMAGSAAASHLVGHLRQSPIPPRPPVGINPP